MKRLLLLVLLLAGCPSEGDGTCEEGAVQCPTNRTIMYCDAGVWGDEEACPPRQGAGGLEITTYCYPDQGVCAP